MYNILNTVGRNRTSNLHFIPFNYALGIIEKDVEKFLERCRRVPVAVRSDHQLVRTLQSLNVLYKGDLAAYRGYVESMMNSISGRLGYSCDRYKGTPFFSTRAQFYGNRTIEILIADEADFDLRGIEDRWEDLRPVRVLSHPRSDVTIEYLDGKSKFTESGICVIEVNVPMMAVQFQLWKARQRRLGQQTTIDPAFFVGTYVIPNMVWSHLDVSIMNRISRQFFNESYGRSDFNNPFYVTDMSSRIDDFAKKFNELMAKDTTDWYDLLRNIPAMSAPDMLEVHRLPKMSFNSQSIWSLFAARMNLVTYLLGVRKRSNSYKNQAEIVMIERVLLDCKSSKYLSNGLPRNLASYYENYINSRVIPLLREGRKT